MMEKMASPTIQNSEGETRDGGNGQCEVWDGGQVHRDVYQQPKHSHDGTLLYCYTLAATETGHGIYLILR